MAGFREREKRYFPLQNIQSVVNLFRDQLENSDNPNLALLSIVLGVIENTLTVNRAISQAVDTAKNLEPIFPVVELSTVDALYQKFVAQVRGSVDLTLYSGKYASRELVKKVSDVIWNSLTRSYCKDKAHLQSLYSYLTGLYIAGKAAICLLCTWMREVVIFSAIFLNLNTTIQGKFNLCD